MVRVAGGEYFPLYRGAGEAKSLRVSEFFIDRCPVSNQQFLEFVQKQPAWQRGKVKRLFAGERYLSHWKDAFEPETGTSERHQPVTNISWFAAKAYCASVNKRLPRLAEWEFVAAASEGARDGRSDARYLAEILEWYARPNPRKLAGVGQRKPNFWGVYDLHGLVWEWVADFNSALVTGESRGDSDLERNLYCGSGAESASPEEKVNYAAFMRYGFRSSLRGDYTVSNLGFRCARDGL